MMAGLRNLKTTLQSVGESGVTGLIVTRLIQDFMLMILPELFLDTNVVTRRNKLKTIKPEVFNIMI